MLTNLNPNSAVFKRLMKESQRFVDAKTIELQNKQAQEKMIKDTIGRVLTGRPEHREKSFIKYVDGVLMNVKTDNFANITDVSPIKKFDDLNTEQRSALAVDNPRMYKMLKHDVYSPNIKESHVDLMIELDIKFEEWELMSQVPQKPDLTGLALGSLEASEATRQYLEKYESVTSDLANIRNERELYTSGRMSEDLRGVQEEITYIKKEINGDI
ncbi:hypothetical protein QF028_003065 [Neobacillus sp. B4I6]|uniref:hypothetical protein n=1 Tax=Neobacillus sp. B4I6 TaxID=3373925 RepID=UPI003D1BA7B5